MHVDFQMRVRRCRQMTVEDVQIGALDYSEVSDTRGFDCFQEIMRC
jgi:hypothetical protein